jgi:hypothetical protein
MLPIDVGWLEFPRVICHQMGPLVSRTVATVQGCLNVATALLAASVQLSAVSAPAPFLVSSGSGLATPEKPATVEVCEAQELQNVLDASRRNPRTAESSWSFSAQANPRSAASFKLPTVVRKARELLNVLDASRRSPLLDRLPLC